MKRKGKGGVVSIDVVEIGPDTTPSAKERLATCSSNRNHTLKHVNAFVYLAKLGKFRDYGFIYANGDGDFYDGQNRLRALIKANHTAKFLVVKGLSPDDMNMMIDSGKKRSNSQRLAKHGFVNASLLCTSVEECLDFETHWHRHVSMLFPDQVLEYLDQNMVLVDYAREWAANQKVIKPIQPKLLVALQYLTGKIDSEKCDQFFFKFKKPSKLKKDEPLYAFFEMVRLVEDEDVARLRNLYIKNGLIQAWNAFYKGETLEKIEPSSRILNLEGLVVTPITEILGDVGELEGDVQSSEEEEASEDEESNEG